MEARSISRATLADSRVQDRTYSCVVCPESDAEDHARTAFSPKASRGCSFRQAIPGNAISSGKGMQRSRCKRIGWLVFQAAIGLGLLCTLTFTCIRFAVGSHNANVATEGKWAVPVCERCPVGSCKRDKAQRCKMWSVDHGYHCQVEHCDQVPSGPVFSECWVYRGQPFYSIRNVNFPCKGEEGSPEQGGGAAPWALHVAKEGGNDEAIGPAIDPKLKQPPWHEVEAGEVEKGKTADTQREQSKGKIVHVADEDAWEGNIFDRLSSLVTIAADAWDPYLTAYWDVGNCGPYEDDHNSVWCGGLVHTPRCQHRVPVNASVCTSTVAHYVGITLSEETSPVHVMGCDYWYIARYECMPVTTTTTTTTLTTTTTTTTTQTTTTTTKTSSTSTSTETMTSTTLTTSTKREEGRMMRHMVVLEDKLLSSAPSWEDLQSCKPHFKVPPVPALATDLNGVPVQGACFDTKGPHYVHVIGDWGGEVTPKGPRPAKDKRMNDGFLVGVDDCAQLRVAEQMRIRAGYRSPDYILNAGDNFYWGGIQAACGSPTATTAHAPTGQFHWNFENVYKGDGLDGKPWLGVLGNHDYGGYKFDNGWDQLIGYTWTPGGRWIMPGQYWMTVVQYPGFSVDYYFVDTNHFGAKEPHADPGHNICSGEHNKEASCGAEGPTSAVDCPKWFSKLWDFQKVWLDRHLANSTSDWQIVVTHYPPTWGQDYWTSLSHRYGIDLFVTGHMHRQELHHLDAGNFLKPTAWIVSGGGGGITSEDVPNLEGYDDQYGFFELTLTKEVIEIQGISHGGKQRSLTFVHRRPAAEHNLRAVYG